jgi:Asp/Glu/hydantoin racemase
MTVAFLHTDTMLPAVFNDLADELIPGVERFHIVDESLLINTRKAGEVTPSTKRRVLGYVSSAVDAGADVVVVTCPSIGRTAEESRSFVSVPVLRIDEPMVIEACRYGSRIGVLATATSTLEPTVELIGRHVREVTVTSHVCAGAFEALHDGDGDRHDELVRAGLREIAGEVDVVVLAQASMARIADAVPPETRAVPILSSPRLGMLRVAELVQEAG